jgi:Protein of unknown function (DUF3179)
MQRLVGATLAALVSLACCAYPIYVIRPFRYQGATELRAALFIAQIGPWLSIVCAVACAALVLLAWTRLRGWLRRSAAVACVIVAAAGAYLARFNLYEQMFHPIREPKFEAASIAKIDADDMVIAVRVNRANRAYPIREIAYHHVANDTLGGVPIVATY